MDKLLHERLHSMVDEYREEEAVWVSEEFDRLVRRNKLDEKEARRRARAAAVVLRPGRWLGEDEVVEYLLMLRLVEPDVADLQDPLDDPEVEKQLRLGGRRLGSPNRHFTKGIVVNLPVDLVVRARRAAWRLSPEDELRLLREQQRAGKITYHRYRVEREKLAAEVVTWAELLREAIARYRVGPR